MLISKSPKELLRPVLDASLKSNKSEKFELKSKTMLKNRTPKIETIRKTAPCHGRPFLMMYLDTLLKKQPTK